MAKVGEGSFGEVFKVKFKEDGRLYAIKRSRQRFRGDNDRLGALGLIWDVVKQWLSTFVGLLCWKLCKTTM